VGSGTTRCTAAEATTSWSAAGGNDLLDGGAGDDRVVGGRGDDILRGGGGRDTLDYSGLLNGVQVSLRFHTAVGDGHDRISGFDNIIGSRFDDVMFGDPGENRLTGGAGDNFLDGRDGRDTVVYYDAPQAVTVDLEASVADGHRRDTLVVVESVVGSRFGDVLRGDGRDNWLTGREGDDLLDGRGGNDVASFAYAGLGVSVRLENGPGSGQGHATGEGTDTLIAIEGAVGSTHADVLSRSADANWLSGGAGSDRLLGLAGDDQLFGGADDDRIDGGAGNDLLVGGAGADLFVFGPGAEQRRPVRDIAEQEVADPDLVEQQGVGEGLDYDSRRHRQGVHEAEVAERT
jgi:Ca2+-binding RTX toxin-like protein